MASDATDQQIQRAYRRIALLTHPDRAGTARAEEFLAATEAYEVLSQKRAQYDKFMREEGEREAERRARERAKADRAAQERRREAERRLRQQQPRSGPSTWAPDAPLYATYDGRSWSSPNAAWQNWIDKQIAAIPGEDTWVYVEGRRTFYRDGFLIESPDGGWVELPPRLLPGRWLIARGRGDFARFGGPRGDLWLDYHWPPRPLTGDDFETTVKVSAKQNRRGIMFFNPVNGSWLRIPPRSVGSVLRYQAQGFPGEFDGRAGDLRVRVEPEGSRLGLVLVLALIAAIVVATLVCVLS